MTLFNTASTLWRAPPLCSHAPTSISRLALAGVTPTAYSNCFAPTAQGSQPAVKPDAFCENRLLPGNKWLFFPEAQLPVRYHRGALTLACAPPRAARTDSTLQVCTAGRQRSGWAPREARTWKCGQNRLSSPVSPGSKLLVCICFAFWVKTKAEERWKSGAGDGKKKGAVSANTGFVHLLKNFHPREKVSRKLEMRVMKA